MRNGLLVAALAAVLGFGQTDDRRPAQDFEVASVKVTDSKATGAVGARGGPGTDDPTRFTFGRATLSELLMRAYDMPADQVTGPAWLKDRGAYAYDVQAILPPGTNKDQFRFMLQRLLAERFHPRIHRESQTRSGYELVVSNRGPKLREWDSTKSAPIDSTTGPASFPDLDPAEFPELPSSGRLPMGYMIPNPAGTVIRMSFRGSMPDLCRALETGLRFAQGAPSNGSTSRVADRTQLTAVYELRLAFSGSAQGVTRPFVATSDTEAEVASEPSGFPNLFVALEKQVGLKLQKAKDVVVEVLFVDNADKVPAEN